MKDFWVKDKVPTIDRRFYHTIEELDAAHPEFAKQREGMQLTLGSEAMDPEQFEGGKGLQHATCPYPY